MKSEAEIFMDGLAEACAQEIREGFPFCSDDAPRKLTGWNLFTYWLECRFESSECAQIIESMKAQPI